MKKWNLIIDVEKCEDCNNCFLACKDEHVGNDFPGYAVSQPRHGHRWINIQRKERGQYPCTDVAYLPLLCFHCDDAPCVKASKNGAVTKRKDGLVMIDPEKAAGQENIVKSCPFGAIWWNQESKTPQKCTFCAHLLDDGWKEPRCVNACPTGALLAVCSEESEFEKRIKNENLQVYAEKGNLKPRVYYKNLYRYTHLFVAGSVAHTENDTVDCVASADITLFDGGGNTIATQKTDCFGDFKFDNLGADGNRYQLKILHPVYKEKIIDIELEESRYLGVIQL